MTTKVNYIPAGYHSLTPYLTLNDCARAIDFYKKAFNAQELVRMAGAPGKIMHAEIKIGDSFLMLADEMPGMGNRAPLSLGGTSAGLLIYVQDVDSAFQQAIDAGAKPEMPPMDMFWGDRYGRLQDPFGHSWALATHTEDVAPDEMKKRMQQEMAKQSQRPEQQRTAG
jgi:PhnB protein